MGVLLAAPLAAKKTAHDEPKGLSTDVKPKASNTKIPDWTLLPPRIIFSSWGDVLYVFVAITHLQHDVVGSASICVWRRDNNVTRNKRE